MNLQPNFFQEQKASLVLNQEMLQNISLLKYSTLELLDYIREQALENPLIESEQCLKEVIASMEGVHPLLRETRHKKKSNDTFLLENIKAYHTTLSEFLLEQARFLPLNKKEYKNLAYFIHCLDDNGYLTTSVTEISASLTIPEDEGKKYVALLKNMDPIGVGAANLQEYLLLQLEKIYPEDKLAKDILIDYFLEFAEKKWKKISKELHVSVTEIQEVHSKILKLQPRPAISFQNNLSHYIRPDITVQLVDNELKIQLKDELSSGLTFHEEYISLLKKKKKEEFKYIHQKYKEFLALKSGLHQREVLLLSVSQLIVQHQNRFFYNGPPSLIPLKLKDIAENLGLHESTISRIVSNKFMETPFGTFSLRSFFTQGISAKTKNQDKVSSTTIKDIIKKIIQSEDALHPLSDQRIQNILEKDYHIEISRRAITKYREAMHIPSSTKRKIFS